MRISVTSICGEVIKSYCYALLPAFIMEGNAKYQLGVIENKNKISFLSLNRPTEFYC